MTSTEAALRTAVAELMPRAKRDLTELVALKSIADGSQPDDCSKAAEWLVQAFTDAGLRDVRRSTTSDGSDAVHGVAPGPEGAPTVLLYCHYDVQPPLGAAEWKTPIWTLTEGADGRWYGRGAADCKGNVVMHLTALRALAKVCGEFPLTVKLIAEGSEEQGTGGLEHFVPPNADLLRADAICVVDTGNSALGVPTLTTSLRGMVSVDIKLEALESALHSGTFGGPAPDPVAGLIAVLATLHDADGDTTVAGLDNSGSWHGDDYATDHFRADAKVLDGVDLIGTGSVADRVWARYAATVVGMDLPSVAESVSAIQASATARVSLRLPPGESGIAAQDALAAHLAAQVPWGLRCEVTRVAVGDPFTGSLAGPAFDALQAALEKSYGVPMATSGQGGSIPLCNVLQQTFPDAEIMLYGVEEPSCLIHAPNESVAPAEIAHIALAEALFMVDYAECRRR
ncbi:dipeptidase [Skermania piniformis]|uniref:Dipeptidase n=1 Tax=Skermania pinensis TaxID=39122 RepID=A0ABX8SFY7_9ACTN|nr:dipeptidase [Skermania piniformis]QXQ15345.1 dipeptidase [Skermania piniformis]